MFNQQQKVFKEETGELLAKVRVPAAGVFVGHAFLYRPFRLLSILLLFVFVVTLSAHAAQTLSFGDEMFRNHGAVMLLIDPASGAIVEANRAAVNYYGYEREQLLQMQIQQINSLSREQVEQEVRLAAQQQRNYFLFQHRLADGRLRAVEVYSSPVTLGGRSLLYSIVHDIGQREALQGAVAANEVRLRFAEQVAGLGHWTLDLETGSYRFSEGAREVLGIEGEHWPVAEFLARVVAADRQRMTTLRQALIDGHQRYRIDIRFNRPDGRLIDLRSEAVYDAAGNEIFGVIQDTTAFHDALREIKSRTRLFLILMATGMIVLVVVIGLLIYFGRRRKKAESALRHSEQRFDKLARQSRTFLWEVDTKGRYTFVSDVVTEVLGYHPGEIIGHKHFYDLHPQQGREEFKQSTLAAFEQQESFRDLESPMQARDGRILWVSTMAMPLTNAKGELLGYRGSDTDISERKQFELALQHKNEEMKQFVYAVSHDLKSPLITVQTFLGLLQEDMADNNVERIDRDIANIEGAADKMGQMLEALQQLSQIGHSDSPPSTISLDRLVKGCLKTLAGPITDQQISVTVEVPTLLLHGDQLQLGRIWQNLVENAIKYMGDQAQPRIDIGVQLQGEDRVFFVRDNGMGIDPKHSQRIFAMFAKLDPSSSGNGLGLALVKKIVDRYRGRIWVESAGTDSGSCFCFTLPDALVAEEGQ